MSTSAWLRELGATRPMAVASEEVLVLGKWHSGFYPIQWRRYRDKITRDFNGDLMNKDPIEEWQLFGININGQLTREDCERILSQLKHKTE